MSTNQFSLSQLAVNILVALLNAYNDPNGTGLLTPNELKAAAGATDPNAMAQEVQGLLNLGLIGRGQAGPDGKQPFGLTEPGIEEAQRWVAPPAEPVVEYDEQPAEQAQPTVAPRPQAQAAPQPAAKKGGKKAQAQPAAQQAPATQPAAKSSKKADDGTFKMTYKRMDTLTAQELAERIQTWTLAAQANEAAGQVMVAEGLMRTVARAQRRYNNMTAS